MMTFESLNLGHVTDDFSVAPQLALHQMESLREMGYRSVLVVRPDHEVPGQPNHVQIGDAARAAGLESRYTPCNPATMGPAEVTAFARNIKALPTPIVAFCASGRRARTRWMMFSAQS